MKFVQLLDESMGKTYTIDGSDLKKITGKVSTYNDPEYYVAVTIGTHRKPRKGEWYISGAKPVAYMAPNDLDTSFAIARLEKRTKKKSIRWV